MIDRKSAAKGRIAVRNERCMLIFLVDPVSFCCALGFGRVCIFDKKGVMTRLRRALRSREHETKSDSQRTCVVHCEARSLVRRFRVLTASRGIEETIDD